MLVGHAPHPMVEYRVYRGGEDLGYVRELVDGELSEPYNTYSYQHFLMEHGSLCVLAFEKDKAVGTIVCRKDYDGMDHAWKGYVGMLSVAPDHRRQGIARALAVQAFEAMRNEGCAFVFLETEVTNEASLALYGSLGFTRTERHYRFYLNGSDAFVLTKPL